MSTKVTRMQISPAPAGASSGTSFMLRKRTGTIVMMSKIRMVPLIAGVTSRLMRDMRIETTS